MGPSIIDEQLYSLDYRAAMGYDSALLDKSMNIGTQGVHDVYIHIMLGSHRHQYMISQ